MTAAAQDPTRFPVIRPPAGLRIYLGLFMTVWCVGVLFFAVTFAVHGSPAAIVPVLMLAFGVTLGIRMSRLSVILGPDALVVRNSARTRTIARSEIEGFRTGPVNNQPFGLTVYALLRDGSVFPLNVTTRPYRFGRGPARLAAQRTMLQAWLERTPQSL